MALEMLQSGKGPLAGAADVGSGFVRLGWGEAIRRFGVGSSCADCHVSHRSGLCLLSLSYGGRGKAVPFRHRRLIRYHHFATRPLLMALDEDGMPDDGLKKVKRTTYHSLHYQLRHRKPHCWMTLRRAWRVVAAVVVEGLGIRSASSWKVVVDGELGGTASKGADWHATGRSTLQSLNGRRFRGQRLGW